MTAMTAMSAMTSPLASWIKDNKRCLNQVHFGCWLVSCVVCGRLTRTGPSGDLLQLTIQIQESK